MTKVIVTVTDDAANIKTAVNLHSWYLPPPLYSYNVQLSYE